ncbi:hypothetical protein [Cupriavidus sp. CuC1]|uniref:hypothetical protein n=1 Tax=Cupriavidus sp. CuC1 TaxID=3373131 RepID=UPI0037D372B7
MNQHRFTPGPWAVFHDHADPATARDYAEIRPVGTRRHDGESIAGLYLCDFPGSKQEANAQLIAAAPDLLHELRLAHTFIRNALAIMTPDQKSEWAARNILGGNDSDGTTRAHEREAVIAKATGVQR